MLEIVEEIGAAAGFAAVPGLAVLSALYVSQAREVERLRELAGQAPERSAPGATGVPRRSRRRYSRIGARVVAIAVLLGVAAYGLTRLTGGVDSSGSHSADKPQRNVSAVKPGRVTVAVLNATTVPGLAARLRDQIAAAGFKRGAIDDFSDKQLAESVVQYAPGHQAEAKAVSHTVGVSQREPVAADSRALAPDATVIVIAGADKASG